MLQFISPFTSTKDVQPSYGEAHGPQKRTFREALQYMKFLNFFFVGHFALRI